jgi:hypothetical protein
MYEIIDLLELLEFDRNLILDKVKKLMEDLNDIKRKNLIQLNNFPVIQNSWKNLLE